VRCSSSGGAEGGLEPRLARQLGLPPAAMSLSALGRLPVLAHHPTCGRHDHHLLRPFGRPICLGCAGMYPGIGVSLVAVLLAAPAAGYLHAFELAVAALACAVPTFFQPYLQRRWYKLPARFTLGVGFGLVTSVAFVLPMTAAAWALRAVIAVAVVGLTRAALAQRAKKLDNPCRECPWGSFPLCAHNLPAMRALRAEHGADPLLESLIAEFEPLEAYPPRMGAAPPRAPGGQFTFSSAAPVEAIHAPASGREPSP
jgi:hypothetical protein